MSAENRISVIWKLLTEFRSALPSYPANVQSDVDDRILSIWCEVDQLAIALGINDELLPEERTGADTSEQVESLVASDPDPALTTTEVEALTTTEVEALTTTEVEALTTTEVEALTTTQVSSLSTEEL